MKTAPTAPSPGLGEREAVARRLIYDLRFRLIDDPQGERPLGEQCDWYPDKLCRDAADEIERLRTENETLRAEIHELRMQAIADFGQYQEAFEVRDAAIARAEEQTALRNVAEAEGLEHYRRSQVGVSGMMTIVESFKQIEAARDAALAEVSTLRAELTTRAKAIRSAPAEDTARAVEGTEARPLAEWQQEIGDVLWWRFPIEEPPYCGSPLDLGHTIEIVLRRHGEEDSVRRHQVGGWPGYHTHWTPLEIPALPLTKEAADANR